MRLMETLIIFGIFAYPAVAFAYLDPGTGSLLIQFLIATFAGLAFAVRVYWHKAKLFVANLFSRREEETENDVES